MLRLERFAAAIARPLIHADRLRPLSWAAWSTMARSWSVKRTGTGGPRRLSGSRGGRPVLAMDNILTEYEKMWTEVTLSTTIIGMDRALRRYNVNPSAWPIEQFLDRPSGEARFDMEQPYQRGVVWGTKRKRNLIKSLLMDVPVPAIVLNDRRRAEFVHPGYDQPRNWLMAIVDGKQRVTAIREFVSDGFSVPARWFGADADEDIRFSQLALRDQNSVMNLLLPVSVGQFATLDDEQELFDLINFGGLAQGETDDDLATVH